MYINITGQIAANLMQPWYTPLINAGAGVIGGLVTGTFALLGVFITLKNDRDKEKKQMHLDLVSKSGVLMDLYKIQALHYLYAEKLRVGLEIDKYYLDMTGKDKVAVDNQIYASSNFALYRDAKNRTEDVKLQLVRSLEQFWANVNQNLVNFPKKTDSGQKATSIANAMIILRSYKFGISGFDTILKADMSSHRAAPEKQTSLEWAIAEETKMEDISKKDAENFDELIEDLDGKIKDLYAYLGKAD